MKYLNKKIEDLNQDDYKLIIDNLESGKIFVLPTDTIYGLSCIATDEKAVAKIFAIKNREIKKPFITLVSSISMAAKYAKFEKGILEKVDNIWHDDKPTTIILPAKVKFPEGVISEDGNISLRLPKSKFLTKIIKKLGVPLISTSLNISGKMPIQSVENLDKIFSKKMSPDFVLNVGPSLHTTPSSILDLSLGEIRVLR